MKRGSPTAALNRVITFDHCRPCLVGSVIASIFGLTPSQKTTTQGAIDSGSYVVSGLSGSSPG